MKKSYKEAKAEFEAKIKARQLEENPVKTPEVVQAVFDASELAAIKHYEDRIAKLEAELQKLKQFLGLRY